MLVLGRTPGQRIMIADGLITLTVVRVDGNQVSIGVEAPLDVVVDREEVHQRRRQKAAELRAEEGPADAT